MNNLLNTILKDTYTLTSLKHRLNILKTSLLQKFFGAQEQVLAEKDLSWLKSLPTNFIKKFNKDNVYNIFTQLEKQVTELETLTIYLAFEPDENTYLSIGTFARKSFGSSLIVDTKLDPKLIAGAALVWKGVYRDYSLRSQIEQKKSEILQQFKKFLR